ncbi:MAG: class I SAM-dependent methyltransferase [Rhodothermales bacterium]|nr:class I SAM-dependent methyltransferase [Rhodothermales bacterium]
MSRLAGDRLGSPISRAFNRALQPVGQPDTAHSFRAIEDLRRRLNSSEDSFVMTDFGAGQHGEFSGSESQDGQAVERRVGELSRESSVDPFWARVLFFLICELQPHRCLELGGLFGISTAYQCAALRVVAENSASDLKNRVLETLEGDHTLSEMIRGNLGSLSLGEYSRVITGSFVSTLPEVLKTGEAVDFAFVDGHHDGDATVRYFDLIRPRLSPGATVVFDDIAWSESMRAGWAVISAHPVVAVSVAANQFGIVRISDTPEQIGEPPTPESGKRSYRLWLV